MALGPPLMKLPTKTADSGFYRGFSIDVTITAKIIIGLVVILGVLLWAGWGAALPFSLVVVLMAISLIKTIYNDGKREVSGMVTYSKLVDARPAE
ncbi:hypothetical protein A8B82_03810 [Sulfitobacter sp. EhC04]|nr:hypothetical protein A8B82_03810 [Sulfitobacter sp. EhC04]